MSFNIFSERPPWKTASLEWVLLIKVPKLNEQLRVLIQVNMVRNNRKQTLKSKLVKLSDKQVKKIRLICYGFLSKFLGLLLLHQISRNRLSWQQ